MDQLSSMRIRSGAPASSFLFVLKTGTGLTLYGCAQEYSGKLVCNLRDQAGRREIRIPTLPQRARQGWGDRGLGETRARTPLLAQRAREKWGTRRRSGIRSRVLALVPKRKSGLRAFCAHRPQCQTSAAE